MSQSKVYLKCDLISDCPAVCDNRSIIDVGNMRLFVCKHNDECTYQKAQQIDDYPVWNDSEANKAIALLLHKEVKEDEPKTD